MDVELTGHLRSRTFEEVQQELVKDRKGKAKALDSDDDADDEHEVTARPAKAANLRSPERRKAKRESALSPWAVKELIEARTLLQSTEKKVAALEERQRANANSKTSSMKLKRKTATHSVKREPEEVIIRVKQESRDSPSPRKRQRRETIRLPSEKGTGQRGDRG